MPVISRFCGIVIKMYFRQSEHNPPHIHAVYGEFLGLFSIIDAGMFEGNLPSKEQALVRTFILFYQKELMDMWETQEFIKLESIV